MQIVPRRLHPGETDHELLWLSISLLCLAGASTWLYLGLPWPRCIFHQVTGLPCVTCGMTRSAIAFFHGNFVGALKWNPLVFACLCGITAFDVYAFSVIITGAPRLRFVVATKIGTQCVRIALITMLVANWAYLISHWRDF